MARKKKEETKEIELKNDNILLQERVDVESIRNELKSYVDEKINQAFIDEIEKSNKKLIREKSRRLIWKNIIILVLLLIIGFLLYLLYRSNFFDKYFNNSNRNEIVEKDEKKDIEVTPTPKPSATPSPSPTPKAPTLDELKKEYSNLLDDYYVTDSSNYLSDFYDGKLTDDMMKYMTINSFNFATFEKEEDYNIIKESTFKTAFKKLFDKDYNAASFSYDENKIRYVKAMESYMTEEVLVREDNNIKREIKDIKVDGDKIIITTIEGVVKDNKLYNVITNDEVENYKEDSLLKYEDKLNKMIYIFKNNKLISLSK